MIQRTLTDPPKNPIKVLIKEFPYLQNTTNSELLYSIKNILQEEKDIQTGLATRFATLQRKMNNLEDEKERYKLQSDRDQSTLGDADREITCLTNRLKGCIEQIENKK